MLKAVIMAGGSGTRFWPLSRKDLPKQFLSLHGDESLLQQAYQRIAGLVGDENVCVLTNHRHVEKTREQLPAIPPDNVIGEPCGRDTAPCIALAAALMERQNSGDTMIVLAADHLISPTSAFHAAVNAADRLLDDHPDSLVTFGVPPTHPATGYGYLKSAHTVKEGDVRIHRLDSFHEKPALETAKEYLAAGNFFWNSGIFCWRASTILGEIRRASPPLGEGVARIVYAWGSPEQADVFAREFQAFEKISIDFAVMESADNIYMVEAPFEWDDVGSWGALQRVRTSDEEGHVVIGRHLGCDSKNCIIVSGDDHLVSTLGVDNLIIVHTPDVTLVADKNDEQAVKKLLARIESEGLTEYL